MGHSTHGTTRSSAGSSALVVCACLLLAGLASAVLLARAPAAKAAPDPRLELEAEMSCDDELPSQHDAPAWCSDGEGPMCLPALPPHAHAHLWDGPPARFMDELPQFATRLVRIHPEPLAFSRPRAHAAPRTPHLERLERPPRA